MTKRQISDLELELKPTKKEQESLIVDLKVENNTLVSRVKEKDVEIDHAVREGKKEVIMVYNKVLGQVKEKFVKKKAQGDLKVEVQETQTNIVLLEEILTKEVTDLEKELEDQKSSMPQKLQA